MSTGNIEQLSLRVCFFVVQFFSIVYRRSSARTSCLTCRFVEPTRESDEEKWLYNKYKQMVLQGFYWESDSYVEGCLCVCTIQNHGYKRQVYRLLHEENMRNSNNYYYMNSSCHSLISHGWNVQQFIASFFSRLKQVRFLYYSLITSIRWIGNTMGQEVISKFMLFECNIIYIENIIPLLVP